MSRSIFPFRKNLLVLLCLVSVGCSSVRPLAQSGVDLLENTERSYMVRTAAVGGSLVGVIAAIPFSILLIPGYAFDAWGWGVREPTATDGTSAPGDYAVALPGVPVEYGLGIGAGIFAAPFAWVEDAIYGKPGRSDGWVEEVPEAPSGSEIYEDADTAVSEDTVEERGDEGETLSG